MNKVALKLWIENKIDHLKFRKLLFTFKEEERSCSDESLDLQIKLLEELYEDFNLQEVDIEFSLGIK